MNRAGMWLRVSGDTQSEEDQEPDERQYCHDHGYEVTRRYVVHGKSAYKGAQDPDWQRVVRDIEDNVIDVVVLWMVDRLDRRNILHAIPMVTEVLQHGGRIEFSEQPDSNLDSRDPDLDEKLKAFSDRIYAAHQESVIKSKRVLKARAKRKVTGSVWGRPPWGYEIRCTECSAYPPRRETCSKHRKIFAPTPAGRKYLPAIFDMVIAGKSLRFIAGWLDEEHVKTQSGRHWNEQYLGHRVIRNSIYYGVRRNGGELETEALITFSVWQAANAALQSRVKRGRGSVTLPKALLAPVCANPECDASNCTPDSPSPMYRVIARQAPKYRCSGKGPQRRGCGFLVRVDELDALAVSAMLRMTQPHIERTFVSGDDLDQQIGKLRESGADAMKRGDYALASDFMQRALQLESKPRIRPHWERLETDQTEAEYFSSLTDDQRREYLRNRFIVSVRPERLDLTERPDWIAF